VSGECKVPGRRDGEIVDGTRGLVSLLDLGDCGSKIGRGGRCLAGLVAGAGVGASLAAAAVVDCNCATSCLVASEAVVLAAGAEPGLPGAGGNARSVELCCLYAAIANSSASSSIGNDDDSLLISKSDTLSDDRFALACAAVPVVVAVAVVDRLEGDDCCLGLCVGGVGESTMISCRDSVEYWNGTPPLRGDVRQARGDVRSLEVCQYEPSSSEAIGDSRVGDEERERLFRRAELESEVEVAVEAVLRFLGDGVRRRDRERRELPPAS